jgi:hypothetical protein
MRPARLFIGCASRMAAEDQLGHASMNVARGVCVRLQPGVRARAPNTIERLPDEARGQVNSLVKVIEPDVRGIPYTAHEWACAGPPGSRSRHLGSVSRMSRDIHHRPDLLAGRCATSTNVH